MSAAPAKPGAMPATPAARLPAAGARRAWPRPAPALVGALVAWGGLGLAASIGQVSANVWLIAIAALAGLALLDLALLLGVATPEVARTLPEAWPIGVERDVELRIEHYGRGQRVTVHDLHPGGWAMRGLPRTLTLAADSVSTPTGPPL